MVREIRNEELFHTGRLFLGAYDDCFDSCAKCGFTDMDGVIERHDHFLFLEMKSSGAPLTIGQKILLTNLATRDRITCAVMWGEPRKTEQIQIIGYHQSPITINEDEFRDFLKHWWAYANSDTMETYKASVFFYHMGFQKLMHDMEQMRLQT